VFPWILQWFQYTQFFELILEYIILLCLVLFIPIMNYHHGQTILCLFQESLHAWPMERTNLCHVKSKAECNFGLLMHVQLTFPLLHGLVPRIYPLSPPHIWTNINRKSSFISIRIYKQNFNVTYSLTYQLV